MKVRNLYPAALKTDVPLDAGGYEIRVMAIVQDKVTGGYMVQEPGYIFNLTLQPGQILYIDPEGEDALAWSVWLKHEKYPEDFYLTSFIYSEGGAIFSKPMLGASRLKLQDVLPVPEKQLSKRVLKMRMI